MAKKLRLQVDDNPVQEEKVFIFDKHVPLFFSGFCLTDNINFAEFFLSQLPNEVTEKNEIKNFTFTEDGLSYQIGDYPKIIINEEENNVTFDDFFIDISYFMYFTDKYPNANFYWLKSFLKEPILGIIGVLVGTKLVGLLKLKIQKEN